MQKINFEDLPSTATPINATNLNAIQTNAENAINSIIESGSNANGNYIKYSDGTMICYGTKSGTTTVHDYWGQFERTDTITINYPQNFISTPAINLNNQGTIGGPVSLIIINNATSYCEFQLLKADGSTDGSYNTYYIAIGKWK